MMILSSDGFILVIELAYSNSSSPDKLDLSLATFEELRPTMMTCIEAACGWD